MPLGKDVSTTLKQVESIYYEEGSNIAVEKIRVICVYYCLQQEEIELTTAEM